jgi:hypothetical protein
MSIFNKAKRCYKQLEERLDEDGPCQVGFLWLMAHIARGQGWHQKLLSKLKDSPVKPAGGDICAIMYATCKDAWRRGKAGPDLCLNALIWCRTQSIKINVLEPDTPHMRIAVTVEDEAAECGLPPACRSK